MKFSEFKRKRATGAISTPIINVFVPTQKSEAPIYNAETVSLGQRICPLCGGGLSTDYDAPRGKVFYQCLADMFHWYVRDAEDDVEYADEARAAR